MATLHILSVGYNRTLMFLRSEVLHGAGYEVKETYSMDDALSVLRSGEIDLLLICHTVPKDDQEKLVAAARSVRTTMPVLCISVGEFASAISGCDAVRNTPVELLDGLRLASLLCMKDKPGAQPG